MKILVTGGTGLVGNAIKSISTKYPQFEFLFVGSNDCDLTNFQMTSQFFLLKKPDVIIHLAACVGGLYKNMNYKLDMLENNLLINLNVLRSAHIANIQTCVSCLSTCIFPDKTSYPINESMLHDGPPHNSNDAYAYAKRMLEIHSKAYCQQHSRNYFCIIPTNIYGPHDNFHLENAHVIPALIHKCYLAKQRGEDFIVRGSGTPLRQFIYSEDLAELILWTLINNDKIKEGSIILSVDEKDEVSIGKVAEIIAENYDYRHRMIYDATFSDGQFKKTADNSKLMSLIGNYEFTNIKDGLKSTIEWFNDNYHNCRK